MKYPDISIDRYKICIRRKLGDPGTVYIDRRMGLTWPSVHNPGYCALYGMHDTTGTRPVELLYEYSGEDLEKLLFRAMAACNKFKSRIIYSDLSTEYETGLVMFDHVKRMNGFFDVHLFDTESFNSFEQADNEIKRLQKYKALLIPKETEVKKQGRMILPMDLKPADGVKSHQRFYALNALNQVLLGWKFYPFMKPITESASALRDGYDG